MKWKLCLTKLKSKMINFSFSHDEVKRIDAFLKNDYFFDLKADESPIAIFESKFKDYIGTKYALSVSSGTMALNLSLMSLNLKREDEILMSALSFITPLSSTLISGAKPILIDINKQDFNIDTEQLEAKITKKTRAIILVHSFGLPIEYGKVKAILNRHKNLVVIEDCAQSCGARYLDEQVGSFGDIACFSFNTPKNLNCLGGGMITTNNKKLFEKLELLSGYGVKDLFNRNFDTIGYNVRLNTLQAVIGIERLKKLERCNKERRERAELYKKSLSGVEFQMFSNDRSHVYYVLAGLLPRDCQASKLNPEIITYRPMLPLYRTTLFKKYLNKVKKNEFLNTESVWKRLFYLKVNPEISYLTINRNIKYLKPLMKQ